MPIRHSKQHVYLFSCLCQSGKSWSRSTLILSLSVRQKLVKVHSSPVFVNQAKAGQGPLFSCLCQSGKSRSGSTLLLSLSVRQKLVKVHSVFNIIYVLCYLSVWVNMDLIISVLTRICVLSYRLWFSLYLCSPESVLSYRLYCLCFPLSMVFSVNVLKYFCSKISIFLRVCVLHDVCSMLSMFFSICVLQCLNSTVSMFYGICFIVIVFYGVCVPQFLCSTPPLFCDVYIVRCLRSAVSVFYVFSV